MEFSHAAYWGPAVPDHNYTDLSMGGDDLGGGYGSNLEDHVTAGHWDLAGAARRALDENGMLDYPNMGVPLGYESFLDETGVMRLRPVGGVGELHHVDAPGRASSRSQPLAKRNDSAHFQKENAATPAQERVHASGAAVVVEPGPRTPRQEKVRAKPTARSIKRAALLDDTNVVSPRDMAARAARAVAQEEEESEG